MTFSQVVFRRLSLKLTNFNNIQNAFITDSENQFVANMTKKSLSFQFLYKLLESAGIVKQELAGGYGHQKHCVRLAFQTGS